MSEPLQWLNLLLVPVVGILMQIRADLAALRTRQEDHGRRLTELERTRS